MCLKYQPTFDITILIIKATNPPNIALNPPVVNSRF